METGVGEGGEDWSLLLPGQVESEHRNATAVVLLIDDQPSMRSV